MLRILQTLLWLLLVTTSLRAEILQVRHDHDPWGKCTGEMEISEDGIEFRSKKKAHSRQWDWLDVQSFDRRSERAFSILTWEDQKWKLGLDRFFDFTILPETTPLSSQGFSWVQKKLEGTVTDRIAREITVDYSLQVKHLHTFGGCEGTLEFGDDWVVYKTDHSPHARSWRRDREVESVWSLHRYQLELHVFEENQRSFDKTRRFRFQLKEPLDEEYYWKMRRELLPGR